MTPLDAAPLIDLEETARLRRARLERIGAWALP
ncbi:MAG: ABC transporter permease, partial [Alphaproteobacteria bacterium]|nr:ABC transporter permease [Alphaproteobacteria bacterium]